MGPSSIIDIFFLISALVVAFVSSLIIEFGWVVDLCIFRILKFSVLFVTAFFGVRFYLRSTPKVIFIPKGKWKRNEEIRTHMDSWVEILESVHKKGKYPSVEIIKRPHKLNFDDHIIDSENGKIKIFMPSHRFDPDGEDLFIKITV